MPESGYISVVIDFMINSAFNCIRLNRWEEKQFESTGIFWTFVFWLFDSKKIEWAKIQGAKKQTWVISALIHSTKWYSLEKCTTLSEMLDRKRCGNALHNEILRNWIVTNFVEKFCTFLFSQNIATNHIYGLLLKWPDGVIYETF